MYAASKKAPETTAHADGTVAAKSTSSDASNKECSRCGGSGKITSLASTKREKWVKRMSFMVGVMNVGVSGFIIGAYPTMYYLW